MNFNYDLITWIEYFLGAFACCFANVIIGIILLKRKPNYKIIWTIIIVSILAIITVIYSLLFDNIVKVFMSILIMIFNYYLVFREKTINSLIYGIITYIIFIISEIFWVSTISFIKQFLGIDLLFLLSKSIIGNTLIGGLSCLIASVLKNKINLVIKKLSKNNTSLFLIQGIICIFTAISSINFLYINDWQFNYDFVLNLIIILGTLFLIQSLLIQYIKNKEIVDKYSLLEEYMKTSADLVEKYSSTVHKYKNNLIAVKGYYKNSNIDGDKYINSLLESYETKKYSWFSKINYIPFDSIRYLIYYKLSKAEELNLKIFVNVDKNVTKIKSNLLDVNHSGIVLEILGEYFDNALYASNESEEKEFNFNLYLYNNKISFELANTFLHKVDLNSIYKNGYTTKGKGHGLGLYEVDKSIKNNDYLDGNIEIKDNYFISRLLLKTDYLEK